MRRLAGTSVVTALTAVAVLLMGGLALADIAVSLYLQINTNTWDEAGPGPSGVTQISSTRMIVVDTERNLVFDDDIDLWEISFTGEVIRAGVLGYGEPTGVAYNPSANTLYVSSDSDGGVHEITPGSDGLFGTNDDIESLIDIPGGDDIEDPVFDPTTGDLFVLNGGPNARIYRVDLPSGNVLPNPFDISDHAGDFEGLAMTPAGELLAGTGLGGSIHVFSTQGQWQQEIDVSNIHHTRVSGLGISEPGAGGTGYDIWIADRGQSTTSNDGRLWRLSTDGTPPPPTTSTTTTTTATTTMPTTTTTSGGTTTTTNATTTTTTSGATTTTQPGTTTVPSSTTTTPGGGGTTTTTTPPPPPPDPDNPFVDDDGSVFEASIEWLAAEGITQGCNPPLNNRFCPNDRMTRGQMAAFLVRANGLSAVGGDFFVDDEGNVFETAINRLRTAGITQGCNPPTNDRYCPDDFVTRGQMAAFLVRAFQYTDTGTGAYFIDDDGTVFENAINRLRTAGVTQGCNPPVNDRYCPDDYVTRGQMAAFLKRALGG